MAYRIEYSPEAEQHLRALTARQRAMVLDAVDEQLTHQPTEETRQRRPMRPNPLAPWELRVGALRVYYDVGGEAEPTVFILACRRAQAAQPSPHRKAGDRAVSVRAVDIAEAVGSLAEYAKRAGEGPVVVTSAGQPVAVVLAITGADLETISLSTNPEFMALIERSRARQAKEGGLSGDEIRRRLGVTST